MSNLRKRLRTSVLASLVLVAGMVLAPTATAEAPSCYGNSCDGRNPASTNCLDDAKTIYQWEAKTDVGEALGNLELRYSPKCHSNWARFSRYNGIGSQVGDALAGARAYGRPWIWRQGVANSLRGVVGSAGQETPLETFTEPVTNWTTMVTADGTTCSSVQFMQRENHHAGGGSVDELGSFDAPCVS